MGNLIQPGIFPVVIPFLLKAHHKRHVAILMFYQVVSEFWYSIGLSHKHLIVKC